MQRPRIMVLGCAVALELLIVVGLGWAETPKLYEVRKDTISPDGRYGVTVPDVNEVGDHDQPWNVLVELAQKRPIVTIEDAGGVSGGSRGGCDAVWSADSSLLLWTVAGKWFEDSQVLVKVKDGKLLWQKNLRKQVEQAILKRTRKAAPEAYAAKKEENSGNGGAYPDGFSVFIKMKLEKELQLPFEIHADLTSSPKDPGSRFVLKSEMDGVINKEGNLEVRDFQLLQKGKKWPDS